MINEIISSLNKEEKRFFKIFTIYNDSVRIYKVLKYLWDFITKYVLFLMFLLFIKE